MSVAFFDLDRTLVDVNSARLWIRYEWEHGNLSSRQVVRATWWLFKYSLGFGRDMLDAYREAVATLEGREEADLARQTRDWFDDQVRGHLRPGARAALAHHREAGDLLVVATSSSTYAAGAARDAFGLDETICTAFEVVEGRFTGAIGASAYGDDKADRVREWAADRGVDLDECTFYTDSMSDLALLEIMGNPVVVNPDRRLARLAGERGWAIVDWGLAGSP
ncbi:MAG: HAD family hydrolase [Deltaproteobacteria bacterium]|nr:HAD family hydrolase [Deltaproteobacteria bacterium]MBW2253044.1 HAD family hydrolase [Deltaproteobacteria bacterium]